MNLRLLKTCIQKPVIAIVLSIILMVLGMVGFLRLDIRFFPKQVIPVVIVNTSFDGASASLMESNVTNLLENAFAGIDGIQSMSSSSSSASSSVTLQFKLGGDFSKEVNEVRDKISSVRNNTSWPSDAKEPTLQISSNSNSLLGIAFTDPNESGEEVRDYVHDNILPQLQQIPGVGGISLQGSSDYAMRIWLNATKMASLGVTVTDIENALTAGNIDFSAGSIRQSARNYGIVSDTKLKNPKDFANVIIKHTPQGTVRLGDVARVLFGNLSFEKSPMRLNGKPGVIMFVDPVQGANPMDLAKDVKAKLQQLTANLPSGMKGAIIYDQSQFLHGSIDESFIAIGEAIFLVVLVIFLFLGSVRASFIPIVTIPVSLIAVFGLIYIFGFSINTMSLLGIVLAIGLVVDDAIVMLENIYRHIENGVAPVKAAIEGSREIASAVIAMSITLFSVYAPIGMVQGFTAKLFQEFAFTLAGAVIISGFVALTLTPMMCSRFITPQTMEGTMVRWVDRSFSRLSNGYQRALGFFLNHRGVVWGILAAVIVVGFLIFTQISSEFLPQEDVGIFAIHVLSPTNSSVEYSDKYNIQIEAMLKKIPSVSYYITRGGGTTSDFTVIMKPWSQRKVTPMQLVTLLNKQLTNLPGVNASAYMPDVIDFGEQGSDVDINFITPGNYQDLITPTDKMVKLLNAYPGVTNVSNNLSFDAQQYHITINRDLAAELGVNLNDIGSTITAMMSGDHVTDIQSGKRSYEVVLQMQKKDLENFDALSKLYVNSTQTTPEGTTHLVPLSSLVKMVPVIGQGTLHHYNRFRSGVVSARLAPGYTESEILHYINKVMPQALSANQVSGNEVEYAFSGKAQQFVQSQGSIGGIMVMALVLIYLVLSMQFTSFIDPFVILLVVPFSMIGAFLALWLTGGTFNLYSQIGLVTLVGMISKHGILITQFVNQLREEGMAMRDAIITGASIRLRPILMTTAAMVFGALPLALASGPGSIGRQQIGWVVVGGLLLGTFFSLFLVPVAYSYLGVYKKLDRQQPDEGEQTPSPE